MPHHLMNLRHVPDDEADEIRALFEDHEIRYYETPPSKWGISMGGFWVHDDDEAVRAGRVGRIPASASADPATSV